MASTGAGTSGQVLTADASGVPTWQTPPRLPAASGLTVTAESTMLAEKLE